MLTLILGQPAPLPAGALLQLGFCGRGAAQRHMQGVHAGCIECQGSVWRQLAPLIAESLLRQRCHDEGHPAGHSLCLGCTSCGGRVEMPWYPRLLGHVLTCRPTAFKGCSSAW